MEIVHKEALKILDKKPRLYHHCQILLKYERLSWDVEKYQDSVFVNKTVHGCALLLLQQFIEKNFSEQTRAGSNSEF